MIRMHGVGNKGVLGRYSPLSAVDQLSLKKLSSSGLIFCNFDFGTDLKGFD